MTVMLLEWVFTSMFLILVVLALRAALGKRMSAGLRYVLWAVVLVRLLVPVQLFTSPIAGTWVLFESQTEQDIYKVTDEGLEKGGPEDIQALGGQDGPSATWSNFPQAPNPPIVPDAPEPPAAPDLTKAPVWLGWTWLAGAAVVALVLLVSNLQFYWRLRRERIPMDAADRPLRVYAAVNLPSPCLFGMIQPAIYVTPEAAADPAMLRHVLAHEYTHYRHGDHIWSLLRCGALAAHWWNPLVWLAAVLSQRDAELACDEGALKRLGDGERAGYGNTLLALVTAKPGPADLLRCATTMAGDKKSLKERISRIACAPRRILWAAVAAVLVTVLACVCAFGQAEEPVADPEPAETPSGSEEPWQDMDFTHGELVYELKEDGPDDARIELPEYPGVVFHCTFGTVTAITEEGEQTLFGGMPVWDLYLCDLSGDGRRELCARVSFGSGMIDDRIRVYDYAEQTLYELENRGVYDYSLRLEGERLWAEERGYNANGPQDVSVEPRRAGPLILTEQGLDIQQETPEDGGEVLAYAPDLNRNGVPETLQVVDINDGAGQRLEVWENGELLYEEEGYYAHAGYNALFLYSWEGEDYLLRYNPYMAQGWCDYEYQLFTLTKDGQEQVVRENLLEFSINFPSNGIFGGPFNDSFDPSKIADFMNEINGLLAHSVQLLNTDGDLLSTFEKEGRLYDNLWWLDIWKPTFARDSSKSLLENLCGYQTAMEALYLSETPIVTNPSEVYSSGGEPRDLQLSYQEKVKRFRAVYEMFYPGDTVEGELLDLNGDGRDEIVFSLTWGHGTGCYVEHLYIFDAETLEQYDTSGVEEMILSQVSSYADEERFYVSAPGLKAEIEKPTDIDYNYDDHVNFGDYYRFQVKNGKLYARFGAALDRGNLCYCGTLEVELRLEKGKLVCAGFEYLTTDID